MSSSLQPWWGHKHVSGSEVQLPTSQDNRNIVPAILGLLFRTSHTGGAAALVWLSALAMRKT